MYASTHGPPGVSGLMGPLIEPEHGDISDKETLMSSNDLRRGAASAPDSAESKPNQTRRAIVLVLMAGLVASLQGAAIQLCAPVGFQWSALLLQTCALGFFASVLIMRAAGIPYLVNPSNAYSMGKRGVLGGLANLCAFVAISYLDLGVANCLMFTMPLWTAVLAYFRLGQPWGYADIMLAGVSLGGVVLVSELWLSFDHRSSLIGIIAGVVFAMVNADAVLVTNTELRDEHPLSMTVAIMAAGVLFSGAVVIVQEVFYQESTYTFSAGPQYQFLAISVSFGLPLMLVFRNAGFACSKDTSVAQVLYLEVVMSFCWQMLLIETPPNTYQIAGATVIIVGSITAMSIKARMMNNNAVASKGSIALERA